MLPLPHLRNIALLLSAALLLMACSQTSLAYRNLGWLVPWRVGQYQDLDAQQKAWLKPRLRNHLDWHCSSELPQYVDWLQRSKHLLLQPRPDAQQFEAQLIEAEQAFQRIVLQTNPTSIELLANLRPAQIEHLYTRMDKDLREDQQEFLEPSQAKQISERAARMEKRLRPWLGTLNDAQRARLAEWASERRDQNRQWLENRGRWQQAFRATLDARDAAGFPERMAQVLDNRRGAHDPHAAQAYQQSRQAMATLLSDLLSTASEQQRTQATKRLDSIRSDLAGQICQG